MAAALLKLPVPDFIREGKPEERDTVDLIEELLHKDGVLSPHVIDTVLVLLPVARAAPASQA
jgi:hypothetical protein